MPSHTFSRPHPLPMTYSGTAASVAPSYTPESDRDTSAPSGTGASDWNTAQRFGFRFAVVYFLLYTFPGPLGALPYTQWLSWPLNTLWHQLVPWVGAHVLHL